MNRSQTAYLKAASVESFHVNPPGQPRQHPYGNTCLPSTLTPTPFPPSVPPILHTVPWMINKRVNPRIEDEHPIIREIVYQQHTPDRITFWKIRLGSTSVTTTWFIIQLVHAIRYVLLCDDPLHVRPTRSNISETAESTNTQKYDGILTARHTSFIQGGHTPPSKIHLLIVVSPTHTVQDGIPPMARQPIHTQEDIDTANDVFDLISTNDYSTKSDYYCSLVVTHLHMLLDIKHASEKYSTAILHLKKHIPQRYIHLQWPPQYAHLTSSQSNSQHIEEPPNQDQTLYPPPLSTTQ